MFSVHLFYSILSLSPFSFDEADEDELGDDEKEMLDYLQQWTLILVVLMTYVYYSYHLLVSAAASGAA